MRNTKARIIGGAAFAFALAAPGCWEETGDAPAISPALTARVTVSRHEPEGCHAVGAAEGKGADDESASYEAAWADLRRQAAERGANYVVLDGASEVHFDGYSGSVSSLAVRGRLYACPGGVSKPAQPAVARPATPSPAITSDAPPELVPASMDEGGRCEPDCSPGYTCLRGACVPSCNPACWGGQHCGEDRRCHADLPYNYGYTASILQ